MFSSLERIDFAWGRVVDDSLRWKVVAAEDLEMRPIAPDLHDMALSMVGEESLWIPSTFQIDIDFARAWDHRCPDGRYGSVREDALHEAAWRAPCLLGRHGPACAPNFGGRRLRELPDPFAPILAVTATGFVLESIDERGIPRLCSRVSTNRRRR